MSFLNTILNVLFPARCVGCGSSESDFCIKCIGDAPAAERESAKWIFPIFDYRHPPIKKALWLFKYKKRKRFAKIFAEILYGRIIEELSDLSVMQKFHDSLLVPIPLSGTRRRERGYNQTELISKELIKLDNDINFKLGKNILIKTKDTKHQAHIRNKSERMKNIIGSFVVSSGSENSIRGRNIILLDDILTTGATLSEAKHVLKQAGAGKVIAFTVAH